jgi:hypothetical protein
MVNSGKPQAGGNSHSGSPFLCVITPVFDPAHESLGKLIAELKRQTYGSFMHVMISNGLSPGIRELVAGINGQDPRFIYDEIAEEKLGGAADILVNLGRRRNYCLKKYVAERYLFLDADIKIIDDDYFLKLFRAHQEVRRDILITLTRAREKGRDIILPIFPIRLGRIDMANFSFSHKIAQSFNYPTDYDIKYGYANDYRFFSSIASVHNTAILNFISAIRDGNNSYKRLSELFNESRKQARSHFCLRKLLWRR